MERFFKAIKDFTYSRDIEDIVWFFLIAFVFISIIFGNFILLAFRLMSD